MKSIARKKPPHPLTPTAPQAVTLPPEAPANDSPPAPAALEKFDFHGDTLDVVTAPDGEHYVVLAACANRWASAQTCRSRRSRICLGRAV